jgi:NitT/TauT family transport system substrate-binding protein
MALSVAQGAPVFAVAGIVNKSPLCFFSPRSKNIQTPKDLIGKTVLTTLGGSDGAMLPGFLEVNNLTPSQLTVQGVAPAAKVSLVLVGRADAATGGACAFFCVSVGG